MKHEPHYESNDTYIEDLVVLGRHFGTFLESEPETKAEAEAKLLAFSLEMNKKSEESLKLGIFLPLEYLFTVFNLGAFERCVVKLSILPELSRFFEGVFARAHGASAMTLLSPEIALSFFTVISGRCDWRNLRFFEDHTPLTAYFIEKKTDAAGGGLSAQFVLRPRIKSFVLEEEYMDPRLTGRAVLWCPEEEEREISDVDAALFSGMQRFSKTGENVLFCLKGVESSRKKALVKYFCKKLELPVLFADMQKLPLGMADCKEALLTECAIQGCCLALLGWTDRAEEKEEENLRWDFLDQVFDLTRYVFLLSGEEWCSESRDRGYRFVPVSLYPPDAASRLCLWERLCKEAAYPVSGTVLLFQLANKFTFTEDQIRGAIFEAESLAKWGNLKEIGEDCLYEGCYRQLPDYSGSSRVTKVKPVYRFEDLVLPDYPKELLKSACSQVDYGYVVYDRWGFGNRLPYGKGLSMVFAGPPGTGKTMGAQVVAGLLHLELFKVDLAGVVSKYIGETEKNLQLIFDDAKKSQAILFFDEADVLFSKRTEIKDSNDKYSNMEAAFMLQKIEEYEGISILATNYLQNFDEAFKRRIKFIIDFPFPNPHYRTLLWQKVFPPETPLGEDVEFNYLANGFELSGSNIKNIAVNAAFMAATEGTKVGMVQILKALRNEMAKSGKFISKEDLGQYGRFF